MPFSRLLLIAASSNKSITGHSGDRVVMGSDLKSGEVALFFDKIDQDPISRSLEMQGKKCCDGLIFYACEGEEKKTICLVEMKSGNLKEAAEQIKDTREHLEKILQEEFRPCSELLKKICWKACIYFNHSSPGKIDDSKRLLLIEGRFKEEDIIILPGKREIGPSLRGEAHINKLKNTHHKSRY